MTTLEIVLIGAVIIVILLPPRWDPAIRMRIWMRKKGWVDE
jgi:hypothetical protein